MKRKNMVEAYDVAMQALALAQIGGHMAKNDKMENWQMLELLKTLHDLIGDFSGILADTLDNQRGQK